jgi:hypothetical protein
VFLANDSIAEASRLQGRDGNPLASSLFSHGVDASAGSVWLTIRHDLVVYVQIMCSSFGGLCSVCRNIRPLFNFEPAATEDEIQAAALQFVRKISGFTKPSKANEAAFNAAVDDIAAVAARLLASLETTATPKDRDLEAAKAKARSAQRFSA